jgi:integrase
VPKFHDWFTGRCWEEGVVGTNKKPGTAAENKRVFDNRLDGAFGDMRLDAINVEVIAQYRAKLIKQVKPKTANNILNVLSKALRYAEEVRLIERAPRVGLLKTERPEIVCWTFEEYPVVAEAAGAEGPEWRVAVLLAGEAGLRISEVRALQVEDLGLVAGTITISRQTRHGVTGLAKGGTRRVVLMTTRLKRELELHSKGRDG